MLDLTNLITIMNTFNLIIGSFFGLFIFALVILWLVVKRIKMPLKSQRFIYAVGMILLSLTASWVTDQWLELFESFNLVNEKGIVLDLDGKQTENNAKKVINLVFQIFPILISAYLLNSLLSYFLWEGTLVDEEGEPVVPKIIRTIVSALIYVAAAVVVIAIHFGEFLDQTLVGMGTSGAVGALVAREPLQKAFTALSLNISKILKKGDIIKVGTVTGTIQEIGWSSVKLLTANKNLAIIPNTYLTKSEVINFSRPEENLTISINVSAPSKISQTRLMPLLKRSAQDSELVKLDPEPIVRLRSIGQQLMYYTIDVVSDERRDGVVKSQVLKAIASMLRREGIHETPDEYKVEDPIDKATQLLNQVPLLEPFTAEEDAILAQGARWYRYSYPERVVIQGEKEASLYIVAEGELDVLINTKEETNEEDEDGNKKEIIKLLKVAELGKNAIFGEMALLTGEARTATIRAKTETLVCKISKEIISPILSKRQSILEGLSQELAKKQVEIEQKKQKYDDAMAKNKQQNTAKKIFSLMKDFFKEDEGKKDQDDMML